MPEQAIQDSRRVLWVRRGLGVAAAAGLVVLFWLVWDEEVVMAWVGQAGPLPFFAAMVLLPALGAPLTPFFVVAGATFGVSMGLIGSAVALLLNLTACYWLAHGRLRPRLVSLLHRFGYAIPDFEGSGRSAVRFTFLVKLAPGIPAFVKHYGLGAAGVPFGLYVGAGMLVTGAFGFLLIVLGESLMERAIEQVLPVAAVVGALAVGLWWWRRRTARRLTAAIA